MRISNTYSNMKNAFPFDSEGLFDVTKSRMRVYNMQKVFGQLRTKRKCGVN